MVNNAGASASPCWAPAEVQPGNCWLFLCLAGTRMGCTLCCWHAAQSAGGEPAAPWGTAARCRAPACPNLLEMPGTATGSKAGSWPHDRAGESRAEGMWRQPRGCIPAHPSGRGQTQHCKHRPSSWGCMHCPSPSPPRLQDQHRWNRESSRRVPGTDGLLTPQPLSAVPCWLGLRAVLLHSHADYECKTNSSLQGLMGGNPDHRIAPAKEVLAIVACLIQGI